MGGTARYNYTRGYKLKKKIFTTYEVSQLCDVDLSTVINWINQEKLAAYKTPGRHRRVRREDLVDFLKKYNMPIPKALEEKQKILLVDDDPVIIDLIMRTLKKEKDRIEIRVSRDGFEAGKQVGLFHPDLVILDLKLPGLDGSQICRNIKGDPATKKIKILAISGSDTTNNRKKILAYGADSFLAKPFDVNDLIVQIDKILSL